MKIDERLFALLESELLNMVKATGHHGKDNFKEYARQRCKIKLSDEQVNQLFCKAGFK